MSRTQFLRFFDRGLPKPIAYVLLGLAALAVLSAVASSQVSSPRAVLVPTIAVPAALRNAGGTNGPVECDLKAGISTDCVFMD
jgi:hypothetical protein